MPNKPFCILFTSAGSRSVEGIIDCLKHERKQFRLIGTNSVPEFVSLNDLDAAYLVPATASSVDFRNSMEKIIKTENPDIIINGRDEEVPLISRLCLETQTEFIGPLPTIADIFSDKYETYLFCCQHHLPFVKTAYYPDEINELIRISGFPIIVKPRKFGHASKDVYILTEKSQIEAYKQNGNYIFQPFIASRETMVLFDKIDSRTGIPWIWNPLNEYYNIDLLLGPDGREITRCITQAKRSGSIIKSMKLSDNSYLHSIATDHAEVLGKNGHRGPLNIQGFLDENNIFQVFEWNARFVGSVYGFALLGKNLLIDALKAFLKGFEFKQDTEVDETILFRPMRYEAVSTGNINTLKHNGFWKKNETND